MNALKKCHIAVSVTFALMESFGASPSLADPSPDELYKVFAKCAAVYGVPLGTSDHVSESHYSLSQNFERSAQSYGRQIGMDAKDVAEDIATRRRSVETQIGLLGGEDQIIQRGDVKDQREACSKLVGGR